jgi:hypothetical protein
VITSEVPHKKISIPNKYWKGKNDIYYVSKYPEGDAHIHVSYPVDKNGYAGSEMDFLLEDGTIETVRGPYCLDGAFDFGESKMLAELLNDDTLTIKAYRLVVGKNLKGCCGSPKAKEEIVYQEIDMVAGDINNRIKKEWEGLECDVYGRGVIYHRHILNGQISQPPSSY